MLLVAVLSSGLGRKASKIASFILTGPVCMCSLQSGAPDFALLQQPGQRQNPPMRDVRCAAAGARTLAIVVITKIE